MNILLFFVLPISIIILSVVLQKVLKCPALVAATFFAILLIIAYTTPPENNFLIYVIMYTILSYVTAVLTRLICNIYNRFSHCFNNLGGCVCEKFYNRENGSLQIINNNKDGNSCCYSRFNDTDYLGDDGFTGTARSDNGKNNLNNLGCGKNSASFTVSSSQQNPVFYLTSKSGNNGNSNKNCCCRRRYWI